MPAETTVWRLLVLIAAVTLPAAVIVVSAARPAQAQPGRPGVGQPQPPRPGMPNVPQPPRPGFPNNPQPPIVQPGMPKPVVPPRQQPQQQQVVIVWVWKCTTCSSIVGQGPIRPALDRCPNPNCATHNVGQFNFDPVEENPAPPDVVMDDVAFGIGMMGFYLVACGVVIAVAILIAVVAVAACASRKSARKQSNHSLDSSY